MDKKLLYKLITIALLSLILLIPLAMIEGQIAERGRLQSMVRDEIAQSSAGQQTLIGPVVGLRYSETEQKTERSEDGKALTYDVKVNKTSVLPAAQLSINGDANVETRHRGLYQAQLFHSRLAIEGKILIPPHLGLDKSARLIDAQATLILSLTDLRGVDVDPVVNINGKNAAFRAPKTGSAFKDIGGHQLHIDLGAVDLEQGGEYHFSFPLQLTGSEALEIAPTAENNRISLKSDWPHPSFQGRFLPRERSIGQTGFSANWEISHLARSFQESLRASSGGAEFTRVQFIEPVNIYQKSERAVKYGSLFIVLSFAAFFLGEILRSRPMHPLQYLLIGLALALFFLILVALSEHISFALSYLASACASILLITVYLSGALGGLRPALGFGAGFTGLFGVLYGVLLSEDNALLMGTALLFVALTAIMLSTRKLNWYRLSNDKKQLAEDLTED